MFHFCLFLTLIIATIATNVELLPLTIVLFAYLIFAIFKFKLLKAKYLVSFLATFLIVFFVSNIGNYVNFNKITGIVIRKKENYIILSNGIFKYYVPCKNNNFELFDIVSFIGSSEKLNFNVLESQFDFGNYLNENGVFKSFNPTSQKVLFSSNIVRIFNNYKKNILSQFNLQSYEFASIFLFNDVDSNFLLVESLKDIGYLHLVLINGGLVSFYISLLERFFKHFCSNEKSCLIAYVISIPYLLINSSKVILLKILLKRGFKCINIYFLKNKFSSFDLEIFACLILLIFNNFWVYNLSFVISFLFNFSFNLIYLKKENLKSFLYSKMLIFLLLIPILISMNNSINLVTFVISMVISPLIRAIVIPYFLGYFHLFPRVFNNFYNNFFKIFDYLNVEMFDIYVPEFSTFMLIFYYLIIFLIIYFWSIRSTKLKVVSFSFLFIFLVFYTAPIENISYFKVSFINIGQGDSTLITYLNKNFLIDTGGNIYNERFARETLIPYFKKNRIYKLDKVFITHYDYDHSGSLEELKNNFVIKEIYDYDNFKEYKFNKLKIENLNKKIWNNENDNSLVLKVTFEDEKFLFMGDASKEVEKFLISNSSKDILKADYLKVGHHGSNTSSSLEFLKIVSPKEAIISCGYNNRYGFPHKEVIENLNKIKATTRITHQEGTIIYKFMSFM